MALAASGMDALPPERVSAIGPATAVPQWLSLYSVNSTVPVGVGGPVGPATVAESPNLDPTVPEAGSCGVVTVEVGTLPKSLPAELTLLVLSVTECSQPAPVPGYSHVQPPGDSCWWSDE